MATVKEAEESSSTALDVLASDSLVVGMSRRQDAVEAITNLSQLTELLGQDAVQWEEIEPSFAVATKDTYEGVPLVIGAFRLNVSNKFGKVVDNILTPGKFISLLVAPFDENSGDFIGPWTIVNDGSTGIAKSLIGLVHKIEPTLNTTDPDRMIFNDTAAHIPAIVVKGGFRASRYPYTDAEGNVSEATTWYLAS